MTPITITRIRPGRRYELSCGHMLRRGVLTSIVAVGRVVCCPQCTAKQIALTKARLMLDAQPDDVLTIQHLLSCDTVRAVKLLCDFNGDLLACLNYHSKHGHWDRI